MSERKKLKYGEAKIQFIACLNTVIDLQKTGYNVKAIYRRLCDKGSITMSYNAFHQNILKLSTHVKRTRQVPVLDNNILVTADLLGQRDLKVKKASSGPPSMPKDKILSLGSDLNQRLAASREFIENHSQEGDGEVMDAERINRITGNKD